MRFLAHSLLFLVITVPAAAQQAPDSARVYELSEVEVLPRPQNAAEFAAALRDGYPPHLRAAGVGGTVQVAFIVGPDGVPGDVRVLATPDSGLNAPTVQAVSLLRFAPAQVAGRAVPVRVEQPITWRVEAAADFAGQGAGAAAERAGNPVDGYELREVEDLPRPLNGDEFGELLARESSAVLRAGGRPGMAEVRFRVEEDGTTTNHAIVRSTDARFDEPALRAIRVLRFRPARIGGRPVRVWVTQPVQWTLGTQSVTQEAFGAQGGRAADAGAVLCEDARCVDGAVDVLPRPHNPDAIARAMAREYPSAMRAVRMEGEVVVRFRIERDGTISDAQAISASHPAFVEPSLRAIRTLRYTPALVDGEPVAVWAEQPLHWPVPPPSP